MSLHCVIRALLAPMFNKENERFARPTETQPVATTVCTCWRCAVPRPVLLHLENLVSIDLRLPPPFKRVK